MEDYTINLKRSAVLRLVKKTVSLLNTPKGKKVWDLVSEGSAPAGLPVNAIVATTGLNQPEVSQTLAGLKRGGLVTGERRGKFIYYRVLPSQRRRLENILSCLE